MFDLTVFPLSIEAGLEQYDLPGLLVASAPRKTARLRAQDQILLFWHALSSPSGKGALSPTQRQEILNRLADTYFSSTGSVTAGLRAVITRLNDFLLNRNLKNAQEGQWVSTLNLAVIHNGSLMLGHGGPTHSFVLSRSQALHFNDLQGMRALGLSRQVVSRFYQSALQSGDLLILCSQPPAAWTEKTLANSPQLSLDHLRRRLIGEAGGDFQTVVVRFQEGKGQVSTWKPGERRSPTSTRETAPTPVQPVPVAQNTTPVVEKNAAGATLLPVVPDAPVAEKHEQPISPEPERPVVEPPLERETAELEAAEVPVDQSQSEPAAPVLPGEDGASGVVERRDDALALSGTTSSTPAPAHEPEPIPGMIPPWEDLPAQSDDNGNREEAGVRIAGPAPVQTAPAGAAPVVSPRPRPNRSEMRSAALPTATGPRPTAEGAERVQRKERPAPKAKPAQTRPAGPPQPNPIKVGLAALWQKSGPARAKISSIVARLFPERKEPLIQIPASVLLLISIAVPLIVVAVATTVYLETGSEEQYQILFTRAQQYAQTASSQTDPMVQRENWNQVYKVVRDAEIYLKTDESQALKEQALAKLDELEGFVRLDYQTVIQGGLETSVNITQMVPTVSGVYLLDANNGNILHLNNTSSGFGLDPNFRCGAGKAGSVIVGQLIDLAVLPINNDLHAAVVGVDAAGTLVYCSTGSEGFSASPLALPDAGWGEIKAMTTLGNTLYVLDPKNNAVYWYDGKNGVYSSKPHLFFDASIPKMDDVIDLAVDQDYLYMLHADGKMTLCEMSQFAFVPTKCTDPMPYGDNRPGRDPNPFVFVDSHLTQLQTTQPPDPSLYALDAINKGVYHFSLRRLNLQRQYRPMPESDFPLPNSAPTAFAVTQNRRILLAFGNQIFFAATQ